MTIAFASDSTFDFGFDLKILMVGCSSWNWIRRLIMDMVA